MNKETPEAEFSWLIPLIEYEAKYLYVGSRLRLDDSIGKVEPLVITQWYLKKDNAASLREKIFRTYSGSGAFPKTLKWKKVRVREILNTDAREPAQYRLEAKASVDSAELGLSSTRGRLRVEIGIPITRDEYKTIAGSAMVRGHVSKLRYVVERENGYKFEVDGLFSCGPTMNEARNPEPKFFTADVEFDRFSDQRFPQIEGFVILEKGSKLKKALNNFRLAKCGMTDETRYQLMLAKVDT